METIHRSLECSESLDAWFKGEIMKFQRDRDFNFKNNYTKNS